MGTEKGFEESIDRIVSEGRSEGSEGAVRSDSAEFDYAQGMALLRRGEYDKAAEFFAQITAENKVDPRGYWGMLLSVTKCLSVQSNDAEEYFRRAITFSHPAVKKDIERQYELYKQRMTDQFVSVAESKPSLQMQEPKAPPKREESAEDEFEKILAERRRQEERRRDEFSSIKTNAAAVQAKRKSDMIKLAIAAAAVIIAVILLIVIIKGVANNKKPADTQTPDPGVVDTVPDDTPPVEPVVTEPDYDLSGLTVKPTALLDEPVKYTIDTASGLNMRKGPASSYEFILTIPNGANVEAIAKEGDWVLLVYSTSIGWSSSAFLKAA